MARKGEVYFRKLKLYFENDYLCSLFEEEEEEEEEEHTF